MAINIEGLEEEKIAQKKLLLTAEALTALEEFFDGQLALNYQKSGGLFGGLRYYCQIELPRMSQENKLFLALDTTGGLNSFFDKYRRLGWKIKYSNYAGRVSIIFTQKTTRKKDNTSVIGVAELRAKKERLHQLQAECAELEAQIEMLENSPNHRDAPMVLPLRLKK